MGYKKTAHHLWPDMKEESRYAKLKHSVNGTNGESLRFGQVTAMARSLTDAVLHPQARH